MFFFQNNFLSPLLMASLQWNPNWWLECEAAAQCEQLAALAEKPTDDAFGEPVFASSLSLLGIMITSPGSGVDTHAAFLNLVHCNFNMTNCIFKTPLVPVVVRPPVPNILSSSVPSFSSSPKPRNISHSWIWCYHVMMDQFMSRTFLSPIWSLFLLSLQYFTATLSINCFKGYNSVSSI